MKKYEIINNFERVSRKNIVNMELGSDKNYEPALLIDTGNIEFQFPLVNGYMISRCNEFLRSFGTDAEVEFRNYQQYGNLVKYIMRIIFLTSLEPRILTSYILHDKGRISKLMLKRKEEIIANYDRGWDIEPVDEDTEIALAILLLEHN